MMFVHKAQRLKEFEEMQIALLAQQQAQLNAMALQASEATGFVTEEQYKVSGGWGGLFLNLVGFV